MSCLGVIQRCIKTYLCPVAFIGMCNFCHCIWVFIFLFISIVYYVISQLSACTSDMCILKHQSINDMSIHTISNAYMKSQMSLKANAKNDGPTHMLRYLTTVLLFITIFFTCITQTQQQSSKIWLAGFFCGGPAIWNWSPDSLRDPVISRDSFKRSLKTFLYSAYPCT